MKLILNSPTLHDDDVDLLVSQAFLDQAQPGGLTSVGEMQFTRDEWTRFCAYLGHSRRVGYENNPVASIQVEVQDEQGRQAI